MEQLAVVRLAKKTWSDDYLQKAAESQEFKKQVPNTMQLTNFLRDLKTEYNSYGFYVKPDLPKRKLKNVLESCPANNEVLAILDHTVFGSAKNFFGIGSNSIFGRNDWTTSTGSGTWHIPFEALETAQFVASHKRDEVVISCLQPWFDQLINRAGSGLKTEQYIDFLERLQEFLIRNKSSF